MKIQSAVSRYWVDMSGDIAWYFPDSAAQSLRMLRAALDDGTDCIAVCGGDGTVRTICSELIGSGIPVAVVPTGSGNGLARHFSISTNPVEAVRQISEGSPYMMDAGFVNDNPFFVSASVAFDAAIAAAYEQLPFRGVGSYVAAGFYKFFDYVPQPVTITADDGKPEYIEKPMILSIGNLSGWGGGAYINRFTDCSDGLMDLIAARQQDTPVLLSHIADVFSSGLAHVPKVMHKTFRKLVIERPQAQPIQLDGEIVYTDKNLCVSTRTKCIPIIATNGFDKAK